LEAKPVSKATEGRERVQFPGLQIGIKEISWAYQNLKGSTMQNFSPLLVDQHFPTMLSADVISFLLLLQPNS